MMSHTTGVRGPSRGVAELRTIVRTRGSPAFLGVCEEGHSFCGSRTPLFSPPFSPHGFSLPTDAVSSLAHWVARKD